MSKYLIARAEIIDPETGKKIPVDVRTRAEAVACEDGRTAQEHFRDIIKHMADSTLHPSVTKQAGWDAKETTAGAQSKANEAVARATVIARSIANDAKNDAVLVAANDATAKANNAKADAIAAAAADATDKLSKHRVGSSQIADSAVTADKLNNGAVTNPKIENGAVTADKLASNAVDTSKIVDSAVTTRKLANGAVTLDKLAGDAKPADFVTASGTSGDWTYRKWKSGIIEAWAEITAEITLTKVFGITTDAGARALMRGTFAEQKIPSAVGFSEPPAINISIDSTSPAWCASNGAPSSASKTPSMAIMAWSTGTDIGATIKFKFHCIGK